MVWTQGTAVMNMMVGCIVVGQQIIDALENGVSKYPMLEGRFPQVAGISFGFNPRKLPGQRIDPRRVKVQGSYIELDKVVSVFYLAYKILNAVLYYICKFCLIIHYLTGVKVTFYNGVCSTTDSVRKAIWLRARMDMTFSDLVNSW